jgi:hypothetical protein
MSAKKEWMLGLPGHNQLMTLDEVGLLVRGGQLRNTDLVKKLGEPWKSAGEMQELETFFEEAEAADAVAKAAKNAPPKPAPAEKTAVKPAAPAPAKPAETSRTTARTELRQPPARTTTARYEAAKAPPLPKPSAEEKALAEEKTPPPAPPPAEEPKPVEEKKSEGKKPGARTERVKKAPPPPKPPPRPVKKLDPMVAKYYGPVDLLRCASYAFEPKKLLLALIAALPLAVAGSLGMAPRDPGAGATVILLLSAAIVVFGIAFTLTGLAYATRRQLEGEDYGFREVAQWVSGNLATAVIYPAVTLTPSGAAFALLWALGMLRDRGPAWASFLKVAYGLPMLLASVALTGIFAFQLGSMYVPAAGAVEGEGMPGAARQTWIHARRQWGRVVLHWLIVTVAFGVITAVCLGIAAAAVLLPQVVWGPPPSDDPAIGEAWANFGPLFLVYRGIAFGLGMILPVSLLSTLGTLSYLSLRHPASVPVSSGMMDETSGAGFPSVRASTASPPMEATQPAETRPAPPDATRPEPARTPPPVDIASE